MKIQGNKLSSILIAASLLIIFPMISMAADVKPPNIIFIMADDLSMGDIEPYGSTQVRTPNIADLAKEGMAFDNMFNLVPICSPTRQSLLTGLGPVRNGAYPNHSMIYPGIRTLPVYMKELGYNAALIGKKHYAPEESYPFDFLGGREHDDGKGQDVDLSKAEDYMRGSGEKPFFLMFTSNQPHSPWNRGDRKAYDPGKLVLGENMVDTDLTRKQMAAYFAEITYLDSLVGVCLRMVDKLGIRENTIIMFATEQGNSFPFSKWTLYDQGLRSGFIVRWSGMVKPGARNSEILQYVDVLPTILDIAGGSPEKQNTGSKDVNGHSGFDGRSFKHILLGNSAPVREYAYGINTTRGIINGSQAYASRSIRDKQFLYIRNLNHSNTYSNVVTNSKVFEEWMAKDPVRAKAYLHRPEEELYDVVKDPYQLHNLAGGAEYLSVKSRMKVQLEDFMKQQGDLGVETEMQAKKRQPK